MTNASPNSMLFVKLNYPSWIFLSIYIYYIYIIYIYTYCNIYIYICIYLRYNLKLCCWMLISPWNTNCIGSPKLRQTQLILLQMSVSSPGYVNVAVARKSGSCLGQGDDFERVMVIWHHHGAWRGLHCLYVCICIYINIHIVQIYVYIYI